MPWLRMDDSFITNPKLISISTEAKVLYIWTLGFCAKELTDGYLKPNQIRAVAGLAGLEDWRNAARELTAMNLWEPNGDDFMVHDYLRYNPCREDALALRQSRAEAGSIGGQHSAASKRQANALASAEANEVANGNQNSTPYPVPYPVPVPNPEPDPEPLQGAAPERRKETRQPRVLFGEDTDAFKLATHLRDRILENKPNAKVPGRAPADLTVWAASIDLLLRIDKRASAEVRRVIDWCQADDFWKTNILSPPTLRRQYDQLEAKMLRAEANANGAAKRQEVNRGADPGESSPYATQGIVFDTDRKTVTYPGRA